MGCDIHIVLERRKRNGGDWIGVYSTDEFPGERQEIARRDYAFFARVAGVCGGGQDTIYPKNLPEDISDLAWAEYMRRPTDFHSASHMPVSQFANAWVAANEKNLGKVRPDYAVHDLLGADREDFEYRVVFWFDN